MTAQAQTDCLDLSGDGAADSVLISGFNVTITRGGMTRTFNPGAWNSMQPVETDGNDARRVTYYL
ncbi:hypothetical protein JYK02_05645 [Corallococcus macrosporus]|uniref:VCBS repeat-containing protein n=1 Tax=Corallococcus macrosporus TaxID=35 RepID=A0ABS3D7U0_9BACT|nr:hypothetical protein [Corallococcus macrosporus]MBN8226991.1 hypothetical protein [Corallococcus macrosporus]